MTNNLKNIKIGTELLYPHHGSVKIIKKHKKEINGETVEFVTFKAYNDPSIKLEAPLKNLKKIGIRKSLSKTKAMHLLNSLKKDIIPEPERWSRRFKNQQEKIRSTDIYKITEVLISLFDILKKKEKEGKDLSDGEKKLKVNAEDSLVAEISVALNISRTQALKRINASLEERKV